jgi:CRISPR-associated protein Cmr5
MMSRTLEQYRAKYALDSIQEVLGFPQNVDKAKYGATIRKLPAMILNNGLGQALAYLLADDEGKHSKPSWLLYQDFQEWLSGPPAPTHPSRTYTDGTPNLIEQLMSGDREKYLRAQQEALALLVWMKKFTDAYLPKGGE